MSLRVLIAEDHKLVSQGLELMVSTSDDLELVGAVDDGNQVVARATSENVDVVLMDINLGRSMSGIEATRLIKEESPDTKVLVLTMFRDPGTVAEAVKAGADGYLSKGASREAVIQAIRDVAEGRAVLDPNVTEGIFGRISGKDPRALSDKELQVLQELSRGKSPREIGVQIHETEQTVKAILHQVFRKLGVHDRTEGSSKGTIGTFFKELLGRFGLDDRIQWNGFRDPRGGMLIVLVALVVAVVVVAWALSTPH